MALTKFTTDSGIDIKKSILVFIEFIEFIEFTALKKSLSQQKPSDIRDKADEKKKGDG